MIAVLRWLLPLLMLTKLVASQPAAPIIDALYGCKRVNTTALDGCKPGDSFYVSGQNFREDIVPQAILSVGNTNVSTITCSYFSNITVACIIPNAYPGVWQSVTVVLDGKYRSSSVSPGLRLVVPPHINYVSAACPAKGCASDMMLSVYGTNLLDNLTNTIVWLSPNFSIAYQPWQCAVDVALSTSTTLYCVLPPVPRSYNGVNLQVKVVNSWGSSVIINGVRYAAPVSSSSSSTGGRQPTPPSSGGSSSSSSVSTAAYLPSIAFVFVICLIVFLVLRRRRASRRRMLLAMSANAAPSSYVEFQNHPVYAPQPMSYQPPQFVQPSVQQQASPPVHAQQQPNVPLFSVQYQPAHYQYPSGGYQPSVPNVYPNVHAYQGQ